MHASTWTFCLPGIPQVLLCITLPVDAGLMLANPVSLYNRYSEIWKLGSVFRNWDLHSVVPGTSKLKSLWLLGKESKTWLKLMLCVLIIHTPQGRGITAAMIEVF